MAVDIQEDEDRNGSKNMRLEERRRNVQSNLYLSVMGCTFDLFSVLHTLMCICSEVSNGDHRQRLLTIWTEKEKKYKQIKATAIHRKL